MDRRVGGGGIAIRSTYVLRNCLIANNSAYTWGGGLYNWTTAGRVENCTIVSNRTTTDTGGGFWTAAGYTCKIENSIVYFNTAAGTGTTSNYVADVAVTWTNCCSAPSLNNLSPGTNVNNITADPQFAGAATGNYRLARSGANARRALAPGGPEACGDDAGMETLVLDRLAQQRCRRVISRITQPARRLESEFRIYLVNGI